MFYIAKLLIRKAILSRGVMARASEVCFNPSMKRPFARNEIDTCIVLNKLGNTYYCISMLFNIFKIDFIEHFSRDVHDIFSFHQG